MYPHASMFTRQPARAWDQASRPPSGGWNSSEELSWGRSREVLAVPSGDGGSVMVVMVILSGSFSVDIVVVGGGGGQ